MRAENCDRLLIAATDLGVPLAPLRRRLAELRGVHHSTLADRVAADQAWLATAEAELAGRAAGVPRFGWLRAAFGVDREIYHAYRGAKSRLRERRREARATDADLKQRIDDAEAGLEEQVGDRAIAVVREALRRPSVRWTRRLVAAVQYFDVTEDGAGVQALVEVESPDHASRVRVLLVADVERPRGALLYDPNDVARNPFLYDDFLRGTVVDDRTLRAVPHSSLDRRLRDLGVTDVADELLEAVALRAAVNADLRRQIDQVLSFALKLPSYGANVALLKSYLGHWAHAGGLAPENMLRSSFLLDALTGKARNQARVVAALTAETAASAGGVFNPGMVFARMRRGLIAAPPSASRTDDRSGDAWMVHYLTFNRDAVGQPRPCDLDSDSPNHERVCALNGGSHFGHPDFERLHSAED